MLEVITKPESVKMLWDLLIQLHNQGFYKRLLLCTPSVDQELSNKLTAVPGLETLRIDRFQESFSIPLLSESELKDLIILDGLNVKDAEILANGLVKLERLHVDQSTIEAILPFIRQSKKLNKIKILLKSPIRFLNLYYFNNVEESDVKTTSWRILNLATINEEREKLPNARKVIIYVSDDVFLATKWAARNGDINLNLIKMKRSKSFEWNFDYNL